MRFIKAFDEIRKGDIAIAGGKGANLGEMTQAGITVPPGVVLTADAYDFFMEAGGIEPQKFESASQIRSISAEFLILYESTIFQLSGVYFAVNCSPL